MTNNIKCETKHKSNELLEKTIAEKEALACPYCEKTLLWESFSLANKCEKLLEFVKKMASLEEDESKLLALADAGYRVEHVLDSRKLLREIGEL
jgi:hypothetical protein